MKVVEITDPTMPLFDAFIKIYEKSFPDDNEREDPSEFVERLNGEESNFRWHLKVVLDDTDRLLGGICHEYYPISRCGLITYICVDPSQRQGD